MKAVGWIVVIIVVIGAGYFLTRESETMMEKDSMMMEESMESETMMEDEMMSSEYTGTVLAGSTAPLLDFTAADYEKVLQSDKLIVLYFYATWCPYCREENANALILAFNELDREDVIGFRVNYNDGDTDEIEKNLAREHGVVYQHTKVFIKNAERILKSPETWDTERYHTEITNALQ